MTHNKEADKKTAALRAVEYVTDGMLVGLGTGSTANYAIKAIGARVKDGLRITAVATSNASAELAHSLSIPVIDFAQVSRVDLTIDGADEIDGHLRAIKGGGGAMMREKIVAAASDRMIVIADAGKRVDVLGAFRLPIEVLPFAAAYVQTQLQSICTGTVQRMQADGQTPYITDQNAYVFDMPFGRIDNPEHLAAQLVRIPGVIAHGLFLDEVDMCITACGDDITVTDRSTS